MNKYYAIVDGNGNILEHSIPESVAIARGVNILSLRDCQINPCPNPGLGQKQKIEARVDGSRVVVTHVLADMSYAESLASLSGLAGEPQVATDHAYQVFWLLTRKQLNQSLDIYAKSHDFIDFMEMISHEDSTVETLKQKALDAICLRDQMVMIMGDLVQEIRSGAATVPQNYQELYGRMLRVMGTQANSL